MGGRRPRLFDNTTPRGITAEEAAGYLGMAVSTFNVKLPEFLKEGFPAVDVLLKRYDKEAIDTWLDARSHLTEPSPGGWRERLGRFRDGEGAGASRDH